MGNTNLNAYLPFSPEKRSLKAEIQLDNQQIDVGWGDCFAKRLFDILMAVLGLGLFFIFLFPAIALCIFLEDRGPIFYKQLRIGRYGKPFWMFKLRSMMVHADEYLRLHPALLYDWQQQGKLKRDPRVTRVGAFLRRSSLDELPQLINVLRGDMSLVGPRAIQYGEHERFGDLGSIRLLVRPGLTGLWQVSGRSTTNYMQRGILDCTYVMECSFKMDWYILCKTLPAVVSGKGAY